MKTKKNQSESFEEILFENRNKAYGAFLLRSTYSRTVAVAAIITLFIFSFIVSWAIWSIKSKGFTTPPDDRIIMDSTRIIELNTPPELPPEKELPPPAARLLKPVVVDSAVDNAMATQTDLAGNANPPVTANDHPVIADSVIIRNDPVPLPEPEPPLLLVKEMPEFPGGDASMVRFLKNNLTYPEEAKEASISGTVYLGFIVERDGSISGLQILRGIGGGCDEEALRVVQMMPKWNPGRQQGHEVRVQFTLPIKFTLQ